MNNGHIENVGWIQILEDNTLWSGFSFLVGFLVIFRTSQSYERFDAGCARLMRMRTEWFDACSALIAFCKHSKASVQQISLFQHMCVRLFSMLHAAALAEIEDSNSEEISDISAFSFPLIDPEGVDHASLAVIKDSNCKVELLYQWIQQVIVENVQFGVLDIPPPILSRVFQELGSGMTALSDAIKISSIPLPFPYVQCCDLLLAMHWCLVPLVVTQWTTEPWWAFVFGFIQTFILWSLNYISVEIENPFGSDPNDIESGALQDEMNNFLVLLLKESTQRTPRLSEVTQQTLQAPGVAAVYVGLKTFKSFDEVWRGCGRKGARSFCAQDQRVSVTRSTRCTLHASYSSNSESFRSKSVFGPLFSNRRSKKSVKQELMLVVPGHERHSDYGDSRSVSDRQSAASSFQNVDSDRKSAVSFKHLGSDRQSVISLRHLESMPDRLAEPGNQAHAERHDTPLEDFETYCQQNSEISSACVDISAARSGSSGTHALVENNAPAQACFGVPKAPPNRAPMGAPPDDEPVILSPCDAIQGFE